MQMTDELPPLPQLSPWLHYFTVAGHKVWYVNNHRVRSYAQDKRLLKCNDDYILMLKLKIGKIE